jgi:hypothetical protein
VGEDSVAVVVFMVVALVEGISVEEASTAVATLAVEEDSVLAD